MTLVQDNSVQAINTALLSIKRDISTSTATTAGTTAGLEPGKTYNINISGNAETATTAKTARTATNANHAETAETATKMSNTLTVNGKTYNGSEAVDAGVQAVENGGTGQTTAEGAANFLIDSLSASTGVPVDSDYFISQRVNGGPFVPAYQRRPISKLWEYIKGKISSVLGLTASNYGGKSAKSSFLDEYPGAGGTRLTSGNIAPKDSSEFGGMRKDVVTDSMTDGSRPGQDGHLLTMFWDNSGRYDSQFFVSNSNPPTVKARSKANGTDYGHWTDIITAADTGYLCKLYYQLPTAAQAYNVILLGKIPDPASTASPATPASSWDIDVDFYFVRPQGHKAAWCNVKAGYGYSNAWRKYGFIETFGVDVNSNYTNPFYLVTLKYNNEYYIGVRHTVNIDGGYTARVKNVNIGGNRNPSDVIDNTNTSLVNMLKVVPYKKTTDGTVLNSEVNSSITDFDNRYAPTVLRNGNLVLAGGGVSGAKLVVQGRTVSSNSYTDANPKIEFKNSDESQNISLTFTDFDAVQAPASLTLNGNQGNEYFIAPCIKANNKMVIPIGAPSSLEDGCIWIER